ncbi:MAG: DUF6265 family protein [Candidatus Acidiferrales bacterium]
MKRIRFSGLRGAAWILLLSPLFAWPAIAQQAAGNGTQAGAAAKVAQPQEAVQPAAQQQAHAPAAHPPALADFSWLEGRWRGEWGSRVAQQIWLSPKAGEMTGVFRLVEGEKVLVLELFSLVEKQEGISFYVRHFTPELLPWETADATLLKLESLDAAKAVFVNPVNGEPKRTSLVRVDADTYTTRSEIEPEQGEPQTIEITFHREKPPAAAPSGGSGGHQKKP